MKEPCVYLMSNHSRTLYIGVTSELAGRVWQHKTSALKGFTNRYRMTKLVCYEEWPSMNDAIAREKRLKGWLRAKKVALIEERNPSWDDLSSSWFVGQDSSPSSDSGSE
jgi:putative endonuclease